MIRFLFEIILGKIIGVPKEQRKDFADKVLVFAQDLAEKTAKGMAEGTAESLKKK